MQDLAGGAAVRDGTSGRRLVILFVLVAASFAAYLALDMPGMSHGSDDAPMGAMTSDMAIGVEDFAARMAAPEAFVVNVHTPASGTITGTDAVIAYDRIGKDTRLPDDLATPVLVYCKTGRMSEAAAETLMNVGYRDVVYLDGGTDAWVAAGNTLA